jgi:Cu(I)/Ag(I) efflux system membrane protein CusA/SilA
MIGGVVTSFIMELLVYPVIYYLWRGLRPRAQDRPGGPT